MTIRLVFATQWYPPEPADVPESIAHAMREQGMSVEVLTGIPNYPSGDVKQGYSAARATTQVLDGMPVHRVPLYPSHDSSAGRRMLNYMSWALASAVLGQRSLRRADVALVYSSPATAALPTMVARLLWRTPYVLLIQDVWPDSIFASGFLAGARTRWIHQLVDVFVQNSYAHAAHIVVISPGMTDLLIDRGVPQDKISVVYNWLPDSETTPSSHAEGQLLRELLRLQRDERVFLYAPVPRRRVVTWY
jgi:colanic acid biosynthesis glycosyl transferase WcaI